MGVNDSPQLGHYSVMLQEVINFLPENENGRLLDVTAGGGGHFFAILERKTQWMGEAWDRDPAAGARIAARGRGLEGRYSFVEKKFSEGSKADNSYHYILADLGISSFQIDDPERGLSYHSTAPLDFRMNPNSGETFAEWISKKSVKELEEILIKYGEELRAKKIAQKLADMSSHFFSSSKAFADELMNQMHLRVKKNQPHPLMRVFQALRIAVNGELDELEQLLLWAPQALAPGGRLAIISFHSLEDRKVKRAFEALDSKGYRILTAKALTPSDKEVHENTRSRSAKLRVLERLGD